MADFAEASQLSSVLGVADTSGVEGLTVATFVYEGSLTTLQYFIMIFRDLMTAIGFLVAKAVTWLRPVEFRARWSGKAVRVSSKYPSTSARTRRPRSSMKCGAC